MLTDAKKRKFCEFIAKGHSVTKAGKALGVAHSTPYYQRNVDPRFAEAWDDAKERDADRCEDRLEDRAEESTHPAFVFGQLKAKRPEKWAEKQSVDVRSLSVTIALPPLPERQLLEIVKAKLESGAKFLPPPPDQRGRTDVVQPQRVLEDLAE